MGLTARRVRHSLEDRVVLTKILANENRLDPIVEIAQVKDVTPSGQRPVPVVQRIVVRRHRRGSVSRLPVGTTEAQTNFCAVVIASRQGLVVSRKCVLHLATRASRRPRRCE